MRKAFVASSLVVLGVLAGAFPSSAVIGRPSTTGPSATTSPVPSSTATSVPGNVTSPGPGVNLWAGTWKTSTGGFAFRLMTPTDIETARTAPDSKELYSKIYGKCADSGGQFYRGGYVDPNDKGKIMGCGSPTHIFGRWLSNDDGNTGSFDIKITARNPEGFTGWAQSDGQAQGPWTGTWVGDWNGDWRSGGRLIIGIGDSLASGEGNPDIKGKNAKWLDRPLQGDKPGDALRCDRSGFSFEAQVAQRIRTMDPNTPFDFVHLACSGASIVRCNPPCRGGPGGLLGPYPGINPPQPPPVPQDLPAQVDEAIRRADGRKPDAVLISIGVNDLEFGAVIDFCVRAHSSDCSKLVYPPGSKEKLTLDAWMSNQLKVLDGRYRVLAERLDTLGVARDHVFLNQYPNLLNDANGQLCKELHVAIFHNLNATEVKWLYDKFFVPLNTEVARAASANHWTLIPEQKAFNDRGYCDAKGHRWIVTYDDSNNDQGNANGTLHPNEAGQTAIANGLWPLLQRALDIPTRS